LNNNPATLNPNVTLKGRLNFENAIGTARKWGKAHRRVFVLDYADDDYQTETQRKTMEYISSLMPTRENGLTLDEVDIRLHEQPDSYLETGTAGVVAVTAKTITDSSLSLVYNELKGYWIGIKFTSGTGGVIDSVAKTLTKAAAGWTVNAWTGYFYYHPTLQQYFYIASNTATALTLLDPNSELVSGTFAYNIEKYFKIEKNEETVFYLEDDDSELVAGTYSWYVDFIVVRSKNDIFQPSQPFYDHTKEEWKTGYQNAFEEV